MGSRTYFITPISFGLEGHGALKPRISGWEWVVGSFCIAFCMTRTRIHKEVGYRIERDELFRCTGIDQDTWIE
jgi:hypothetical protein